MAFSSDTQGRHKAGCVAEIIPYPYINQKFHSTGLSRTDQYPSAVWRSYSGIVIGIEISRWVPVLTAFVWLVFFGYTSETRRLYGPILRNIRECVTPFVSRRRALESLTFGSVAGRPPRQQGELSGFSTLTINRSNVQTASHITAHILPDVEAQVQGNGERSECRSGPSP